MGFGAATGTCCTLATSTGVAGVRNRVAEYASLLTALAPLRIDKAVEDVQEP